MVACLTACLVHPHLSLLKHEKKAVGKLAEEKKNSHHARLGSCSNRTITARRSSASAVGPGPGTTLCKQPPLLPCSPVAPCHSHRRAGRNSGGDSQNHRRGYGDGRWWQGPAEDARYISYITSIRDPIPSQLCLSSCDEKDEDGPAGTSSPRRPGRQQGRVISGRGSGAGECGAPIGGGGDCRRRRRCQCGVAATSRRELIGTGTPPATPSPPTALREPRLFLF
jgi:hypothetical protein